MQAEAAELSAPLTKSPLLGFWDGESRDSLTLALSPPVTQCVEMGLEDQCDLQQPRRRIFGHLCLLVTTKSAYRHPVGKTFVEAIEGRIALSDDLRERIYTATQEALMNAVLHGNLQIESGARNSLEGLGQIHKSIELKLMRPEVALGMIRVDAMWGAKKLYVVVRDTGDGFRMDDLPSGDECTMMGHAGSGRGLSILGAVCDRVGLLNGGTAVKLGFRL